MLNRSHKWDTEDEIDFIKGLPPAILLKYAKTIDLREDWGRIDKAKILSYLNCNNEKDTCVLIKSLQSID